MAFNRKRYIVIWNIIFHRDTQVAQLVFLTNFTVKTQKGVNRSKP